MNAESHAANQYPVLLHAFDREEVAVLASTHLSVRLLVPGTGTWTTKLLWLAASVVGNKQGTVVRDQSLLELVLAVLVDVLLVVGDDALGDGLTDGVDLGSVSTTTDADADVDTGKLVSSEKQNWLVDLESQDLWLDERKRLAVDLDQALALLAVCDGSGSLLLAETLDALDGRHLGGVGGDAVDSGGGSCRVSSIHCLVSHGLLASRQSNSSLPKSSP